MIYKLLIISIFFIGCNSSSSSSSNTSNIKGYLIDANVSGVEYKCNDIEGITNSDGSFYFNYSCNYIIFKIGSVTLATMSTNNIKKDNIFYLTDITQRELRNDTNNTAVKNIARLVQSLDDDYNPNNGINITKSTRDNITNTVAFEILNTNISEDDLNLILIDAQSPNTLISATRALVHVEQVLRDNNISVDTVPPFLPYISTNIEATSNDITYIDINGEKNTKIFLNNIDTNKSLDTNGKYVNFELNTSGFKNKFYDFNVTLKDTLFTSKSLNLHIFKDTDDISAFTFPSNIEITSPEQNILDINITDNSESYGLRLDYLISGDDAGYFDINTTTKKLYLKYPSVAGKVYNIKVSVFDKSNHQRSGDLKIIVK